MSEFNQEKSDWCVNHINRVLEGVIDISQIQNSFVMDLYLVAGDAYDQLTAEYEKVDRLVEFAESLQLDVSNEMALEQLLSEIKGEK